MSRGRLKQAVDIGPEIRERIELLAARPYDWDGKDALPIRPDVRSFLADLMESPWESALNFRTVALDSAVLEPDGTVTLGFSRPRSNRKLFVECPCAGVICYVKVFPDGQGQVSGRADVAGGELSEIQALLDWAAYMDKFHA